METYEQNNEITSSSFDEIRHSNNYIYEPKTEYYHLSDTEFADKRKESDFLTKEFEMFEQKSWKLKPEDVANTNHFTTPFSVKDILNNNQSCESWRSIEDRRRYEYDYQNPLVQQTQAYPDFYGHYNHFHTNMDQYWGPEICHETKIDNYYNYAPYCNVYHYQNYEAYPTPANHPVSIEAPERIDLKSPVADVSFAKNEAQFVNRSLEVKTRACPSYSSAVLNKVPAVNKTSKFT